jgi:hypothetical protein
MRMDPRNMTCYSSRTNNGVKAKVLRIFFIAYHDGYDPTSNVIRRVWVTL